MSGNQQSDLIVDDRLNHAEGNERGNLGVKRRNGGLGGAKLLKTGGRHPVSEWSGPLGQCSTAMPQLRSFGAHYLDAALKLPFH